MRLAAIGRIAVAISPAGFTPAAASAATEDVGRAVGVLAALRAASLARDLARLAVAASVAFVERGVAHEIALALGRTLGARVRRRRACGSAPLRATLLGHVRSVLHAVVAARVEAAGARGASRPRTSRRAARGAVPICVPLDRAVRSGGVLAASRGRAAAGERQDRSGRGQRPAAHEDGHACCPALHTSKFSKRRRACTTISRRRGR